MYNLKKLVCAIFLLSSVNILPIIVTIINRTDKNVSACLYQKWSLCGNISGLGDMKSIGKDETKTLEYFSRSLQNCRNNFQLGVCFIVRIKDYEKRYFYEVPYGDLRVVVNTNLSGIDCIYIYSSSDECIKIIELDNNYYCVLQ